MKTSTSRLDWVMASKKSIDMFGNSRILDIANSDLTLIQINCAHILGLCFVNISSVDLLRLKDQIDKKGFELPTFIFVLIVEFTIFISVQ